MKSHHSMHALPQLVTLLLLAVALAGCHKSRYMSMPADSPPYEVKVGPQPQEGEAFEVLVIADTQFHNVLGGRLLGSGFWADKYVTAVATRPPQLDAWSHLATREVLCAVTRSGDDKRCAHQLAGAKSGEAELVVFLGDLLNVSCSSEFDVARRVLTESLDFRATGFVAVPGNHDGYLLGNWAYVPPRDRCDFDFTDLPRRAYQQHETSWPAACALPDGTGTPLNKAQFIDRYVDEILVPQGITVSTEAPPPELGTTYAQCPGGRWRKLVATTGPLKKMNYEGIAFTCPYSAPRADGRKGNPWLSFIVQRLDMPNNEASLLLVDTSSMPNPSSLPVGERAVSSRGVLGEAQILAMKSLKLSDTVVVAGHHPLAEFSKASLAEFVRLTPRAYLSAHTHLATTELQHSNNEDGAQPNGPVSVVELNIGSLTDWPMEAARMRFTRHGEAGVMMKWNLLAPELDGLLKELFISCPQNWKSGSGEPDYYLSYRSWGWQDRLKESYFNQLIDALKAARGRGVELSLSEEQLMSLDAARKTGDWYAKATALAATLPMLDQPSGEQRRYLLCQAMFASQEEKNTQGLVGRYFDYYDVDRAASSRSLEISRPAARTAQGEIPGL